jgi:hypothetical protein
MQQKLVRSRQMSRFFSPLQPGLLVGILALSTSPGLSTVTSPDPEDVCWENSNVIDLGCESCSIDWRVRMSSGPDCNDCTYFFSWTIACPSAEADGHTSGTIECGEGAPYDVDCPVTSTLGLSFFGMCS